ncbi:hypothetical protein BO82DRAFT_241937, partial [Aspergillus uvarum CBS 121591]
LATYTTLHHETFNIYTHLLPALCFPALAVFSRLPRLHILSSTACLLLSAAYHANNGHSAYALKADYCGILGLLVSNFVTGLHYAFGPIEGEREGEGEGRSTANSTIGSSIVKSAARSDPHRTLRVTALIFTGLSALVPITHLYLLHDARYLLAVGVGWYTLEGMALILGAVVYLNRIPERWYPHSKVFMLWSSHAFWHVLVLVGMVAHTMGL